MDFSCTFADGKVVGPAAGRELSHAGRGAVADRPVAGAARERAHRSVVVAVGAVPHQVDVVLVLHVVARDP